jgi:hypothetical protein
MFTKNKLVFDSIAEAVKGVLDKSNVDEGFSSSAKTGDKMTTSKGYAIKTDSGVVHKGTYGSEYKGDPDEDEDKPSKKPVKKGSFKRRFDTKIYKEELKGNQGVLDKNRNGKLDKIDFKLLRMKKEDVETQNEGYVVEAKDPQSKIKVGHKVRSYDFPGRHDDHYIEGHVASETDHDYHIHPVTKIVRGGKESPISHHYSQGVVAPKGKGMFSNEYAVHALKEDVELDEKFTQKEIKMAHGIAKDKRYAGGNMTGASKVMDKIKPGLSDHPSSQEALRKANEEIEQADEAVRVFDISKSAAGVKPKTPEERNKAAAVVKSARANKPINAHTGKTVTGSWSVGAGQRQAGQTATHIAFKEEQVDETRRMSAREKLSRAFDRVKEKRERSERFGKQWMADATKEKEAREKAKESPKNEDVNIDEKVDVKKKTVDTLAGRVKAPATFDNEHTSAKIALKTEAKDPMMDAGVGSATDFATDASTPLNRAKSLAHNAFKRIKKDLSGK